MISFINLPNTMVIIYLFKNPFNKLKDINTPTFLLEKGKKKRGSRA
jgi:hypothetical protein